MITRNLYSAIFKMQKFSKGIIHRRTNKIIASVTAPSWLSSDLEQGKITVTADSMKPSPRKQPKNDAHSRQGDTSQRMGHVTGKDPPPNPGSHPRAEYPQEVPPHLCGMPKPRRGPWRGTPVPPALQAPWGPMCHPSAQQGLH